ncbi:MAG: LPS export ABC transporter ATP-binding protein, partial [Prevotellaceae bacterium]|nr:LPS export ABC transporter ATP-binding protein [Prevotellaceae bacterium]
QGTPEELASNQTVREKYLSTSFVLRQKDFQRIDEQKRAAESREQA